MANKNKRYTSTVAIHGKEYSVSVINGKRFIDGKTIDEFLSSISNDQVCIDLATVGKRVIDGESTSPQTDLDLLYIGGGE